MIKESDKVLMDDDDLVALIDQEIQYSLGGSLGTNDSETSDSWEKSLDYYLGKPRGDEVEGRSQVISMDMADMVEQTIAQIMPAFDSDDLCYYEGENKQQSMAESEAVNFAVRHQNNGYVQTYQAVKDGLLQRNGIIKVYIDERDEVESEYVENVNDFVLPQLLQVQDTNQRIEIDSREVVSEAQFDELGNLVEPETYHLAFRRINHIKKLVVEAVPPEEFAVNQDHNSIFLDKARFVRHTKLETEGSLIAQGFDPEIVRGLKTFYTKTESDQRARSRDEQENEHWTAHRSNRNIEVSECYYLIDFDGDGIAERRKILKSGSTILSNEWFPCVPFAAGSPYIMTHRFYGLGFYDKLKQTQDIKTAFLRKTIDNAEGLINQRTIAIQNQVNMDDLLSSRPTGVVRAKSKDAVIPFPVQNMGDTGFRMLEYMDKVRKEGAGSQLDIGTSENVPVAGNSAHGMERWMSSKEHLTALFVKLMAETLIKDVYSLAHKLMKRYMPGEFEYYTKGRKNSTQPQNWMYGERVKIKIQKTVAERQREYQALDMILNQQIKAIESGAPLASYNSVYWTLVEQAKTAGLENPESYWIDPSSPEGQKISANIEKSREEQKQMQQISEEKLYMTQLEIARMQETTDLMKAQMKDLIEQNEQMRKWYETELKANQDIPGVGVDNGSPTRSTH